MKFTCIPHTSSSQYKSIILEVTENFSIDELYSNFIILQAFNPIVVLPDLIKKIVCEHLP